MYSGIIETERYRVHIFFLEYFISFFSNAGLVTESSSIYVVGTFLILFYLKYRVEGLRLNSPLLVLSAGACVMGLPILALMLSVLSIYSTYVLVVYKLPQSKTTLSYKSVTSDNNLFTIFYPTMMTTNKYRINLFSEDVGKRMLDMINKDPGKPSKIPELFVKMMTHYYTKLSIGNAIQSASCIEKEYQVIVISHQLGFNSLYSLAQEFVNAGYLVMLVDHPQEIRNIHPDFQNPINKQFRKTQLIDRYQAVVKSLDFILNDVEVSSLLGQNVKVKKDKIHMMGHSFGGSTALYTAVNEPRITGSVIALDPCFFILEDSYTLNSEPLQFPNNTLVLLAQDYYEVHYKFFQNDYRAKVFQNNSQNVRILRMLGCNHANYSELSLFTAGQFTKFNVIRNGNVRLYFQMFLALSYQVLKNQNMKGESELIDKLLEENPRYRKQIEQTFRSLVKENHKRIYE